MPVDFRISDYLQPRRLLALRRTLERTQWASAEALAAYRDERLRITLNRALTKVPYYRDMARDLGLVPGDVRTKDDLKALPLLSKDALRRDPERFLDEDRKGSTERLQWHTTSGTTGEPVRFALDARAKALEFCYYWRHWSWAGYRLGDRFAELGTRYFLKRGCLDRLHQWQPHLRRLMLNSGRLSAQDAPLLAAVIRKRRARFLKGMASALFHFASCIGENTGRALGLRAIFSTGDALTPAFRSRIETVFGVPVLDSYGHMERTVAISQCMQGGYHVHEDYGLLELVDERVAPDDRRVSRVVGTSLYNGAMPLVRYEVGDHIEAYPTPRACACGRTLPLVRAIHGRAQDTIVTPDGRFLTAAFLLFDMVDGVACAQLRQEAIDCVHLAVVPNERWSASMAERLLAHTRELLGAGVRVDLRETGFAGLERDPSGKLRSVIGLPGTERDPPHA